MALRNANSELEQENRKLQGNLTQLEKLRKEGCKCLLLSEKDDKETSSEEYDDLEDSSASGGEVASMS